MYKLLSAIVCVLGCCFIATEGVPVEQLEIIGGQNVTVEQYPYQVQLEYEGKFVCGGAIVGPKHVLTDGWCLVYYHEPELLTVRVGSSYLKRGGKVYEVKRRHVPTLPIYHTFAIGLIELNETLVFGEGVQKVDLAPPGFVVKDDIKSVATGWGASKERGPFADQLQAVELTTLSNETCPNEHLLIYEFCATNKHYKDATCEGDGGSPLVSSNVLIGVATSNVPKCGLPGYPGRYISIGHVRKVIDEYLED